MDREYSPLRLALSGAGSFLVLHLFLVLTWSELFTPAQLDRAWFLGSRRSVFAAQLLLGLVAVLVGHRGPARWRDRFVNGGWLLGGAMAAVTGLFFAIGPAELMLGPARLWPVVLLSALFLLGPAVLAGLLLGGMCAGALEPR